MDENNPLACAMRWLDTPAEWSWRAAALYSPRARLRIPARDLIIDGRIKILAHHWYEARLLYAGEPPTTLRRTGNDQRVIDESVLDFIVPPAGVPRLALPSGSRVELKRTRVLSFVGGSIVDELQLETWTPL